MILTIQVVVEASFINTTMKQEQKKLCKYKKCT